MLMPLIAHRMMTLTTGGGARERREQTDVITHPIQL
jgi:hypothetical protein